MPIPADLKQECVAVMEELCARPIAQMFLDADSDDSSDESGVVRGSLDLRTISTNLRKNKYKTIQDWKNDVEKVWSTALSHNRSSTLVVIATTDLQRQFRERTKFLTDSKRNNWKYALIQMHQELAVCIREILKLRSAGTQKVQRTVGKRDQLYPTLEELPPANLRRHVQFFTHDELVKLTNELNSLKEQSQLALIGSLLKKHEPEITDEADQLEIDINLLKPSTLRLIRDQVDQILHG